MSSISHHSRSLSYKILLLQSLTWNCCISAVDICDCRKAFLFLSLQSFSLQLFIQCESQLTHSNSDVYDRDAFKELDERLGALAYCGQQEEVVHDCFFIWW